VETVLQLLGHALDSGLTPSAFARSGGLLALPASVAAPLTADADAGVPLSQTLESLGLLDSASLGLLRAKEAHGSLPEALRAISDRLGHRRKLRRRLLTLVAYPYGLALAASLIFPLPLLFSATLGAYLSAALPFALSLVALPVFVLAILPRLDPRGAVESIALRLASMLPFSGSAVRNGALAAFADVLGAAIRAGLPTREALPLAAQAASADPAFHGAGARMVERLDRGEALTSALGQVRAFAPTFLAQVGSGEASGRLDAVLEALRKDCEDKSRLGWLVVVVILGTLATVGISAVLAFRIISGYSQTLGTLKDSIDRVAPP